MPKKKQSAEDKLCRLIIIALLKWLMWVMIHNNRDTVLTFNKIMEEMQKVTDKLHEFSDFIKKSSQDMSESKKD